MSKLPALRLARDLETSFHPRELCSIDKDYHVFVVAYSGEYVEHQHDADEFLYVLEGELVVEMRGKSHHLRQGDAFLVPAGTPHRPVAQRRALGMIMERRGLQRGKDDSKF